MQLMELVCTQIKPLGLHIFLLRLVFLSLVQLSTEKVSARCHGRVLGRASQSSEGRVPASRAECICICLVVALLPGCFSPGRSHDTRACFTPIYCDDVLSTLPLAPVSAPPALIAQAFVHTFLLGLFLHGLYRRLNSFQVA